MPFVYVVLLLVCVLTSCVGRHSSQQLLANIDNAFKKTHKINYGSVIARYGLAEAKNDQCLYLQNYGVVINEERDNKNYIYNTLHKCKSIALLQQYAKKKLIQLQRSLVNLDNKYHVFTNREAKNLASCNRNPATESVFDLVGTDTTSTEDHIKSLYLMDSIAKHIPIFFPQVQSSLTSNFGMRKHPLTKIHKFHYGADFAGSKSSPIYAAADGIVVNKESAQGYGLTITIQHGKYLKTKYAHLQKTFVTKGAKVIRGQKIALQGSSGNVTNEHLHFEILIRDTQVNPMDFISQSYFCQAR